MRLHRQMQRIDAERSADALSNLFEQEGYPVAAFEEDAVRDSWCLSIYVPVTEADEAAKRAGVCLNDLGLSGEFAREELAETGWVENALTALRPIRAGRFVVHGNHDAGCASFHERAIEINAAQAFGTGHHGTTAGCLNSICEVLKRRRFRNAIDLGCGTGVLAIAVARAARIPVVATDIDPVATDTAKLNAKRNGVGSLIETVTAADFNHRRIARRAPYDLVVANILAGPLQAMAADLARHLTPGATIILSGLLPHQRARIVAAYRAQGIAFEHAHIRDGWLTLTLRDLRHRLAAHPRKRTPRLAHLVSYGRTDLGPIGQNW